MVDIIFNNHDFPCDGCHKQKITTVRFKIDGSAMLIDLCEDCIRQLLKEFGKDHD